ncbi:MAG: PAS domain-containing protein, partial [Verrucomicrobiota bacterium]
MGKRTDFNFICSNRALVWPWVSLFLVFAAFTSSAAPHRVLIIHSFGREFAPFDTMSSSFRTELARQSSEPVEFYEASVMTTRTAEVGNDGPLLQYLQTTFAEQRLDLIVTVAEPAMHFCLRHRAELFPDTPLLAHVDSRQSALVNRSINATSVPVHVEIPVLVSNILQVLPDTTNVVLVLGASPFERYWTELCRQAFVPFTNRVTFDYLNDQPLDKMCDTVSKLPPRSAILYGMLAVDAAGVPYEQERALSSLHNAANAPIFGPFESQMGLGIVGGRLISLEDSGRQAAHVALRLLLGVKAGPPVSEAVPVVYDWRELHRWKISPDLLPPGSEVLFRVPTFWEEYKWRLIGIHAVALAEGILIFALLRNRRRLRRTQNDLRQSEERLSLATNSARVGVWSWNIQSGEIEATDECKRMFGFGTGEAVGFQKFIDRVHPDDLVPVQRALEEAARSGSIYDTQYRITLPNGELRWIAARGRAHQLDGTAGGM